MFESIHWHLFTNYKWREPNNVRINQGRLRSLWILGYAVVRIDLVTSSVPLQHEPLFLRSGPKGEGVLERRVVIGNLHDSEWRGSPPFTKRETVTMMYLLTHSFIFLLTFLLLVRKFNKIHFTSVNWKWRPFCLICMKKDKDDDLCWFFGSIIFILFRFFWDFPPLYFRLTDP